MFGNLTTSISSMFGKDMDISALLSNFGNLSSSQSNLVQMATETLSKVDFPELKDAIMSGNFGEVVNLLQNSHATNPQFHKQLTEDHADQVQKYLYSSDSGNNHLTNDKNNISEPITTHHAEIQESDRNSEDSNDGSVFNEMKHLNNLDEEATINENKS